MEIHCGYRSHLQFQVGNHSFVMTKQGACHAMVALRKMLDQFQHYDDFGHAPLVRPTLLAQQFHHLKILVVSMIQIRIQKACV